MAVNRPAALARRGRSDFPQGCGKSVPVVLRTWEVQTILTGSKRVLRRLVRPDHARDPLRGLGGGDALWVREAFWSEHETECDGDRFEDHGPALEYPRTAINYVATPGCATPPLQPGRWELAPPDSWDGDVDEDQDEDRDGGSQDPATGARAPQEPWVSVWCPWDYCTLHPAAHMPRWASRLTLRVRSVRDERLQDITPYDILLEGIAPRLNDPKALRADFAERWNADYGRRTAWSRNPRVRRVEFDVELLEVRSYAACMRVAPSRRADRRPLLVSAECPVCRVSAQAIVDPDGGYRVEAHPHVGLVAASEILRASKGPFTTCPGGLVSDAEVARYAQVRAEHWALRAQAVARATGARKGSPCEEADRYRAWSARDAETAARLGAVIS